jgi:hypothetical protein
MNFASDNTGPVHPNVMEALNASNMGYALPYGADDATAQAVQDIRDVFEAPEACGLSGLAWNGRKFLDPCDAVSTLGDGILPYGGAYP